jgi:hypothetical protein
VRQVMQIEHGVDDAGVPKRTKDPDDQGMPGHWKGSLGTDKRQGTQARGQACGQN